MRVVGFRVHPTSHQSDLSRHSSRVPRTEHASKALGLQGLCLRVQGLNPSTLKPRTNPEEGFQNWEKGSLELRHMRGREVPRSAEAPIRQDQALLRCSGVQNDLELHRFRARAWAISGFVGWGSKICGLLIPLFYNGPYFGSL